jgi:hypothetical protein
MLLDPRLSAFIRFKKALLGIVTNNLSRSFPRESCAGIRKGRR